MTTPTFHSYGENPTYPHPSELEMEHVRDHAISRLKSLGATDDQAVAFVDSEGTDVVRSESDGMLKQRIADLTEQVPAYDPADYHVEEVLDYVTEHPDELAAVQVLEAEGKARKTLLARLAELSTPAESEVGESEGDAGVEGKSDGDDADSD